MQSECKRLKDLVQELEKENQNIKAALEEKTITSNYNNNNTSKTGTLTNMEPLPPSPPSPTPSMTNEHRKLFDDLAESTNECQQLVRQKSAGSMSASSAGSSRKISTTVDQNSGIELNQSLHETVSVLS